MNNSSLTLMRTIDYQQMSPRKRVLRKVLSPPIIKGYKPYGGRYRKQNKATINLLFEEYEAMRLSDYDKLNHHQASVMMNVSRPTFTRIYASALQKVAQAFVEGRQIIINGGKVYFDGDWYHCDACQCHFNNTEKEKRIENCVLCGSEEIKASGHRSEDYDRTDRNDTCACRNCGYEQAHRKGKKCNEETCPECNSAMRRKN